MKKRWMKSVIEASMEATPDLPFQRGVRSQRRTQGLRVRKFA